MRKRAVKETKWAEDKKKDWCEEEKVHAKQSLPRHPAVKEGQERAKQPAHQHGRVQIEEKSVGSEAVEQQQQRAERKKAGRKDNVVVPWWKRKPGKGRMKMRNHTQEWKKLWKRKKLLSFDLSTRVTRADRFQTRAS